MLFCPLTIGSKNNSFPSATFSGVIGFLSSDRIGGKGACNPVARGWPATYGSSGTHTPLRSSQPEMDGLASSALAADGSAARVVRPDKTQNVIAAAMERP